MSWDNLVRTVYRAKAKICIQGNINLNQQCLKRKWPLKMSINSQDNQAGKLKFLVSPAKANALTSD